MRADDRIKFVTRVSDPPTLLPSDIQNILQAADQLYAAFIARTADMEVLTGADFRVRVK